MSILTIPRAQIPLVDARGQVTREWYRALQTLAERAGGVEGLSTTDVDAGSFAAMQPQASEMPMADISQAGMADQSFADLLQGSGGDCMQSDVVQSVDCNFIEYWSP